MEADDYQIPLYWPSVGIAALIIFAMAYFAGSPHPDAAAAGIPDIVSHLANGISGFRHIHYAPAGLVLAIGATFGAPSARHSLVWIGIGAAIIAVLPLLITLYPLAAGYSTSLQESAANPPPPGTYDMTGLGIMSVIVGLLFATPLFYAAMAMPIALAGAAISIVLHFCLDRLNGLPLPWQSTDEENDGAWIYDVGGGAAIIAIASYLLLGTLVQSWGLFSPSNQTPQEIVEELKPPPASGTHYSKESGQKIMRSKLGDMKTRMEWIAGKPCGEGNRRFLKDEINAYFEKIRVYEDWQPGKDLTSISAEVRDLVAEGLSKNYIDWYKLSPAAQIHFDRDKYENAGTSQVAFTC
jgi:hypothetical protein